MGAECVQTIWPLKLNWLTRRARLREPASRAVA
jgi:hypothetical protein